MTDDISNDCTCGNNGGGDCEYCLNKEDIETGPKNLSIEEKQIKDVLAYGIGHRIGDKVISPDEIYKSDVERRDKMAERQTIEPFPYRLILQRIACYLAHQGQEGDLRAQELCKDLVMVIDDLEHPFPKEVLR